MSRNLLSEVSKIKAITPAGIFATGDAVTVQVYKDGSSTPEALTDGTVSQISTLGIFHWPFSDLTNAPTVLSQYTVYFKDATTKVHSETFEFGGYPELLLSLPQALDAADECRVTVNLYKIAGGINPIDPDTLFDPSLINHIELKVKYWDGARYFMIEKIKPSYSQDVAEAYWILPRNSIVDVELQSFDISKKTVTIPDQSTIDLFTLIS